MTIFKQFLTENELQFKSPAEAYLYAKNLKRRVPKVEQYLLQSKDISWCYQYAKDIIKGEWEEFEHVLLKNKNTYYCYLYTAHAKKQRWLQGEFVICIDFYTTKDYCKYFKISILAFQEELIQRNPFIIHEIDGLYPYLAKKYHNLFTNKDIGII